MTNDKTVHTTEGRIRWFCKHFGLEIPALTFDTEEPHVGAVLLTDSLVEWCVTEGVNLDWHFCGDARGLIADYRAREMDKHDARKFERMTDQLEPEVKEGLFTAIRSVVQLGVPMPDAIAAFEEVVVEHRAKTAA